jgi:hypothetical protein
MCLQNFVASTKNSRTYDFLDVKHYFLFFQGGQKLLDNQSGLCDTFGMFQANWRSVLAQSQAAEKDIHGMFSAHFQATAKNIIDDEYEYDPAEDGPEINVIRNVYRGDAPWP